uniref:Uncharacterized protein n=1 Tax=Heterorhabditis bacteriophora TaxID=37862 RepID=A0A1I7W9B5_HETBA
MMFILFILLLFYFRRRIIYNYNNISMLLINSELPFKKMYAFLILLALELYLTKMDVESVLHYLHQLLFNHNGESGYESRFSLILSIMLYILFLIQSKVVWKVLLRQKRHSALSRTPYTKNEYSSYLLNSHKFTSLIFNYIKVVYHLFKYLKKYLMSTIRFLVNIFYDFLEDHFITKFVFLIFLNYDYNVTK